MDETNESPILGGFRAKFQVDEHLVLRTTAWSWSIRPAQATLGSGVLSLNRYAARFSDVTASEMADLAALLTKLEQALQSAFACEAINYLMLMMVDKHVHFHVIPRYPAGRRFADLEWLDSGWPAMPALSDQQHRERADVLVLIRDRLQAACAD
jgi:diadenosine tetraphosphate (Ap4A) HIT family hydrolase